MRESILVPQCLNLEIRISFLCHIFFTIACYKGGGPIVCGCIGTFCAYKCEEQLK